MDSFKEIWNAVLTYCEERVTETAFNLWIKKTEFVSFEAATITLRLPSAMYMDVVISQYGTMFSEAFAAIMGFEVKIKYICAEDNDREEHKFYQDKQHLEDYKNEQYTFENFIVGSSNRFAYVAAKAVASDPGLNLTQNSKMRNYNPLFIYGPSGLGKTHLLYAIASVVHKNHPSYNIVYIKGDQFTNELIAALQEGRNNEFRYKYRNADLFLVDDIQFIAGKESTQEEFFHTFNNLYENHHQIVLTADRPPNEMLRLEDRLKTRFEWGLIADIQPPDFETRMAIIKNKSVSLGFDLPNDVCTFIAENVTSNVRLLEGTVKKIRAYHDLDNMELTVPNVSRAIKDMYNKEKAENLPTPNLIIGEVSRFYNIEESVIRGTLKNKNTAEARQVAMYLVRKLTNLSLPDIGKEFGRDHSTVIHSLKKVEQQLAAGTGTLADNIRDITANINSKL